MDKSWMLADRRSKEYDEGVENFLKLGLFHASKPNSIRCPCRKCRNSKSHTLKMIKEHLYFNGVDKSYRTWIWHGEELLTLSSTITNVQLRRDNSESEDELGPSGVDPRTRKRMDKSWMFADRRSKEYDEGVEYFLKIGLLHASNPNSICCPCRKCGNVKLHTVKVVRAHLYFNGIDQSYTTWIWHGEEVPAGTSTTRNVESERCNSESKDDERVPSEVDPSTRKRKDKSWMFADRRSQEYDEGVENFLKFGLLHASNPNSIRCPCRKCGNLKILTVTKIREHLYFNGIDQRYSTWIWHGEECPTGSSTSMNVQSGSCSSEPSDVDPSPSDVDPSTRKRKGTGPADLPQGSSTSMNVQVENCTSEREDDEMKMIKEKVHSLNTTVEKLVAEVRSMKDVRQTGHGIPHSKNADHTLYSLNYVEQDTQGGSLQKGTLTKPHMVSSMQLCAETYKPPTSVKSLLRYAESLMGVDGTLHITSESGLFSMESSIIILTRDDVMQFCKMEAVSVATIQVYMGKLCDGLEKSNIRQKYIFANPFAFSEGSGLKSERARALAQRMEVIKPGQFLLFPYNALGCWMLLVANLHSNIVYFLDPTEQKPGQDLEDLILIAFKIWAAHFGKKVRNGPTWRKVNCPKQSTSVEGGYYTMRYMKDILGACEHTPMTNVFGERDAYTMEEVDEVRSEWAFFVWQFSE